ncbi:MAG: hypothetical protein JO129_01175 [Candidatus Dependentiae bacterium]|nr:hypothetical protein [Candidatus Dependentiae bacterium]
MHAMKKHLFILYIGVISLLTTYNNTKCEDDILVSQQEFITLMHEQENDLIYLNSATEEELMLLRRVNPKKKVTIVIYMAADNDLHPFAWKNIKQMEAIGSNENINIIVQLNTPGYHNPTKRYLIKNGRRLLIPAADGSAPTQKLNSGSPQTLIDCVAWAMKYFPADDLVINLWDHGSGVYDPDTIRIVKAVDLFKFNENTNMLDLDRTIGYTSRIDESEEEEEEESRQNGRGICFDETFKSFMSNQGLKFALSEIQNKVLNGKKIGIVWCDACLMAMLEIADICKDHVEYLVASQEVEYAAGSNYELVLKPFINNALTPREFACHIVDCFGKAYQNITRDYTQSAICLSGVAQLETNVNAIAGLILNAFQDQKNKSITKLLQQCKTPSYCTCFEEPTYIDLRHFYTNLQANLDKISLNNPQSEAVLRLSLYKLLEQGISIINNIVIANRVGSNLQKACGISIYFPERGIFNSYPKCNFAQTNNWGSMIAQYLVYKK